MRFEAVFSTIIIVLSTVVVAMIPCPLAADDWPQWMGPHRDAVWRETGIVDQFPSEGLPVKWRAEVAGGYSGPAVANGKVYLTDFVRLDGELSNNPNGRDQLQGQERILCFDAETGDRLWEHEYSRTYKISYASGPRATPTVSDGLVYALGAEGDLWCLQADSGAELWHKDLAAEYKTETPIWGFCGHPLVDGDLLYCVVGGSNSVAVAFDKTTGDEVWRALSSPEPGYCPPTMIEVAGQRQLLIWHSKSLCALNPATGELFWSEPLEPAYGMAITAPRLSGNLLYVSGIGPVGNLFELTGSPPVAKAVWQTDLNRGVSCSNATPFIDDGTIYGVGCKHGELCAVELSTGRRLWETFKATSGSRRANQATAFIVQHADRYFLFNELGDLIVARLTPQGYHELGRFNVLAPTNEAYGRPVVWSHPAFANRSIFARNDKELVCVSLATSP